MNFSVMSLLGGATPNKLLTLSSNLFMKFNRHINGLFLKNCRMGNNTYISLEFLLLSKKKHLFGKLQLFSQNTDVLHFLEEFFIYKKPIDGYNNLQIPKEKCNLFKVNNKNTTVR